MLTNGLESSRKFPKGRDMEQTDVYNVVKEIEYFGKYVLRVMGVFTHQVSSSAWDMDSFGSADVCFTVAK